MSSRIGATEASSITRTLHELQASRSVPSDVRANAEHLAHALQHQAGRRNLETIAWFLLEASKDRRVPRACRKAARRWGIYLETRA
jgi:uncharacterized protein (UPF0147 family)